MSGTVDVTLAFGAGLAAAFSPCGVAILPSYVGYLLGRRAGAGPGDAGPGTAGPPDWPAAVADGLRVGAVMTAGFMTVFVAVGALLSLVGRALVGVFPWLGVLVGLVLAVLGGSMLVERPFPGLGLLGLTSRLRPGAGRGFLWSAYLYGLAYALASLSCSLPIFLLLVSRPLLGGNAGAGLLSFAAFALGMGTVVTVLSVLTLTARGAVARYLPRLAPLVQRAAGLVVVAAGLYIEYYWLLRPALLRRGGL